MNRKKERYRIYMDLNNKYLTLLLNTIMVVIFGLGMRYYLRNRVG